MFNEALFIGVAVLFFVPMIAIFDWLVMSPYIKKSVDDYIATGKISPWAWFPATLMEALFFLAGIVIGVVACGG